MATRSDTHWGREFDGLEARAQDNLETAWDAAVLCLETARWADALQALANCHASHPARSTEALELAGCVHLMRQGDLRGATARAHFALGQIEARGPWDALALQLSHQLEQQDDAPWAALAVLNHTDGVARLGRKIREAEVDERWLERDGLEELEALIFARADETEDHGWLAMSGLLAAGDAENEFDEQRVLQASKRSSPRNARAWGIELRVLFALDHDEAGFALASQALDTFGGRPRALLEILDTVDLDDELEPLLDAVRETEPEWVRDRTTSLLPGPLSEPGEHGHTLGGALAALATLPALAAERPSFYDGGGLILPEAPKRTDEDWRERKEQGDEALKTWFARRVAVVLALGSFGWIAYNLLA